MVLLAAALLLPPTAHRAVVLTYHDVIPRRGPGSVWFDATPPELEAQLRWLKERKASFVTLDQVAALARGAGRVPPRAVAIVFADNYAGFARRAWPVLKRYGVPTATFVHTGYVGSPVGRPKSGWPELRRLAREGVVVGSQTVSHPADLRTLSDAALRQEFTRSRDAIRRELGSAPRYLAYPNGKYDARVARRAREAGYAAAFTEAQRPVKPGADPYTLPRYVHTRYRQAWRDLTRP